MAATRPVTDQERLPWLDTKVHRRRRTDLRPLLIALFALAAFASVAALSFWFGQRSIGEDDPWAVEEQGERSVSQELPPAVIEPAEEVQLEPTAPPVATPPEAQPQRESQREAQPQPAKREAAGRTSARRTPTKAQPRQSARKSAPPPTRRIVRTRYSGYWPTPATAVRLGRVIQIGTYSTQRRADDAWLKTLRRYPQVQGLPRISSSYKARNGRTYHRVQIMTTAPAQSNWLCRKMRADGRRCTVLGSS